MSRGRGVILEGDHLPWFFELEEVSGLLSGELRVDGWGPAAAMSLWYEGVKGQRVEMSLSGLGRVYLVPKGIRIHESGHHNESSVIVEGSRLFP